ncbi:siderophore-iron reductase FhuF [Arhodomonas sp. AD133]|uniref:siderophore-iron reductase FhuF n=1 Tax=Arhodomonas sp. AD133 TaxID=3415009 RepID=UPI003EBE356C
MSDALTRIYQHPPLSDMTPPGVGTPDTPTVPGEALLDHDELETLLRQFRTGFGADADQRAVVSLWSRHYFARLAIPYLVAHLLLERELPVALDAIRFEIDEAGRTQRFWFPHAGAPIESGDIESRFATLLYDHCEPLIASLSTCSGVSTKVFWNNFGNYFDYFANASSQHPCAPADIGAPAFELMAHRRFPGGRRNPLYHPVRHATVGNEPRRVRRLCCLQYRLEGQTYCGTCPLITENRPAKAGHRPPENSR